MSFKVVDGCLVDKCAVCDSITAITCLVCENGYYLRNYNSDKKYNDCWNIYYLWAVIISIMLIFLIAVWICYFSYRRGKSVGFSMYHKRRTKKRKLFDDEDVKIQEPKGQETRSS